MYSLNVINPTRPTLQIEITSTVLSTLEIMCTVPLIATCLHLKLYVESL